MTTKFAAQTHPLRWGIEPAVLDGLTGLSVVKSVRFDIFRPQFTANPVWVPGFRRAVFDEQEAAVLAELG